jgi:hypothetical protein
MTLPHMYDSAFGQVRKRWVTIKGEVTLRSSSRGDNVGQQ